MKKFWETSPLWQRQEELYAEFKAAEEARKKAGEAVLACVLHEAIANDSDYWRGHRLAYQDAWEALREVFAAWRAARETFEASPAGQAYARYLKDPLVDTARESEAA